MKQFDKIWFLWLLAVSVWNFGWPEESPITDVLAAVVLSITFFQIKK